ncbi:hypothetical protein [Leisingera sp. SS27]|uniref:hypothetical protein n=1 Tax=Leisingera sp. SS27 TaxID=2979462 RepID=UPI0023304C2B|nr:hypothetical protein [Leisingera sp. SS27]
MAISFTVRGSRPQGNFFEKSFQKVEKQGKSQQIQHVQFFHCTEVIFIIIHKLLLESPRKA